MMLFLILSGTMTSWWFGLLDWCSGITISSCEGISTIISPHNPAWTIFPVVEGRKIANADTLFPSILISGRKLRSQVVRFIGDEYDQGRISTSLTVAETKNTAKLSKPASAHRRISKWNQTLTIFLRVVRMLLFSQTDEESRKFAYLSDSVY